MSGTGLKYNREQLNQALNSSDIEGIPAKWTSIKQLVANWWTSYKQWEAQDTFKKAYDEGRMTVRSFDSDFSKQLHKQIKKGDLKVPKDKFFANNQRTKLGTDDLDKHHSAFHTGAEHQNYWQDRGLDSAAFADPANFLSREVKYARGLHDLSASLVKPMKRIDLQLFSSGDGVHLAFVPLSKEEDQKIIWKLTGLAKCLRTQLPEFYTMVRGYRAEMTRIKIARNYDIGTGFIVTPTVNTGQGPRYKLKYGLGTTIKEKGALLPRKLSLNEQQQLQVSLQQEAMQFRQILSAASMDKKEVNEIVIALRKHAGPFPVYAVLQSKLGYCECFDIVGSQKVPNSHRISIADGTMT